MPEMGQDRQEDMAETGLGMIDQLLAHSKKADRMDRAMESAQDGVVEVDVADIVTSTVEDHRQEFPDVTIQADTPPSQPAWVISTLEYAVATLIENACVHVTEPTVEVSVSQQDETVAITVADDGPGIPESEQEAIRTDQETALDHGSGVGLWLVERHAHLIHLYLMLELCYELPDLDELLLWASRNPNPHTERLREQVESGEFAFDRH